MRIPGLIRSVTALCLLALLGALGTGLPTHSHPGSEGASGSDALAIDAEHHTHGTQIVRQDDRAPSAGLQLAALPAVIVEVVPPVDTRSNPPVTATLRPMERAPPPCAPRAPPAVV